MNYSNPQAIEQAFTDVLKDAALAKQLAAQAKPAVWLETTAVDDEAEIALGSTKLGGSPDLPADVAWPERAAYADQNKRVQSHVEDSKAPNSRWRWATPEQAQSFRDEALQHIERLQNPFPLNFLGQINFAEVWATGAADEDFPQTGVLSVFYDLVEQPWGYDPADAAALQLIYSPEPAALARREAPQILKDLPEHWQLSPVACTLNTCCTPLPMETAQWDSLGLTLTDQQGDRFVEWWLDEAENGASNEGEDSGCHRIGGWPTPVQGDMQTECALVAAGHYCGSGDAYTRPALQEVRDTATQWLLLMQIGTDEKAGMGWGDDGQLYLWIRRDDLRAQRFDQARLVLQCY